MTTIITCHFCFKNFEIILDSFNKTNTEIWDCEICCNPNKIRYLINDTEIIFIEITNGNE